MNVKDDRVYLEHIQIAINKIFEYTSSGKDAFFANNLIQDGVIRNFEIIGEAVKKLSDEAKERRPEIPWRQISSFRDVLIHNYDGVNVSRVWNVVADQLPKLRDAVSELLKQS